MTRAKDRLIVCSWKEGKNKQEEEGTLSRPRLDEESWYDMIDSALEPHYEEAVCETGESVYRFSRPQILPTAEQTGETETPVELQVDLPEWATKKAPEDILPVRTLRPSYAETDDLTGRESDLLAGLEEQEEGPVVLKIQPDLFDSQEVKFEETDARFRGNMIHALLQHLSGLEKNLWEKAAGRLLGAYGDRMNKEEQVRIWSEVKDILESDQFAFMFGQNSQSEVPILAELPTSNEKNRALQVSGQIDRLVDTGEELLIIDYKSAKIPPVSVAQVDKKYLLQMAIYAMALRPLFHDRVIRCGILWTTSAKLLWIDQDILAENERYLVTKWRLNP